MLLPALSKHGDYGKSGKRKIAQANAYCNIFRLKSAYRRTFPRIHRCFAIHAHRNPAILTPDAKSYLLRHALTKLPPLKTHFEQRHSELVSESYCFRISNFGRGLRRVTSNLSDFSLWAYRNYSKSNPKKQHTQDFSFRKYRNLLTFNICKNF